MRLQRFSVAFVVVVAALAFGCGDDIGNDGGLSSLDADNDGVAVGDGAIVDDGGQTAIDTAASEDVAEVSDISGVDVQPDVGGGPDCPGEFTCPCASNDDCDSGLCVEAQAGQVCTRLCTDTCDPGYSCGTILSGADSINVCLPDHPRLCEPCKADADCVGANTKVGALCLAYNDKSGLQGRFCGSVCESDDQCPATYACEVAEGTSGSTAKQCVLKDGAVCSCSAKAIDKKLATICSVDNGVGACSGERVCDEKGLSVCDAPVAVTETCNGLDDDCDGTPDAPSVGLCDDANNCTFDSCEAGKCAHQNADSACSDNDACTVKDHCEKGECQGDSLVCDDGDVCTDDSCDAAKGCVAANNTAACDDGDVCNFDDACLGGVCLPGTATVCNDGNHCSDDTCDAKLGCVATANDKPCDDGNLCSNGDTCADQKCVGKASVCDDGNPCTDDACLPASGCTATDNDGACDDGSDCSVADKCDAGVCAPGKLTVCNDGNPCTDDFCEPKGGCANKANTIACDDGDPCSTTDTCAAGKCAGTGALNCDDENPCTTDACVGTAQAAGSDGGCSHDANTIVCTDNNVCTVGDRCKDTLCLPGPATVCDDSNVCTTDACDALTGCVTTDNQLGCDDDSACTTADTCADGACAGTKKVDCNDENLCTDDACDAKSGCTHTDNTAACTDNNVCTVKDVCAAGSCKPGKQLVCDDKNPCTTDACSPADGAGSSAGSGGKAGCFATANTLGCDDGNVCTTADRCKASKCEGGLKLACSDGNVCTNDSCDPKNGCQFNNNTLKCDDNNACTTGDKCAKGVCAPIAPSKCDDGNVCTTESCDAKDGCKKVNNTAPCSDGSVCSVADKCGGGVCKAGANQSCDDGNVCTNDSCDAKKGCLNAANQAVCTDGNACTVKDVCAAKKCTPGAARNCDDGKICTTDLCHPASGCLKIGNQVPCDDGSVCTVGDRCDKGQCESGKKVSCDDGNLCTNDSCNAKTGCVHTANTAPCDDGNGCTTKDVCSKGKCAAGAGCADVALCVPGKTTPTCKCNAGYTGNGFVCNDINECSSNNGGCHKDANCINKPGTSACACKPGFSGDGKTCVRRLVRDDFNNSKLLDAAKTSAIRVSSGVASLQPGGIHFGDGKDGNRTVSSNTNLHTASISGRKRADAEQFRVGAIGSNTITINATGTDGTASNKVQESIGAGDEVLLINLHAPNATSTNVGRWEMCEVTKASGSVITCANKFTQTFGPSSNSNLSGQKIIAARVPNYGNLTINSSRTLTGNAFGGTTGGVLALRASGKLTVNGAISMDERGYRGGVRVRAKKSWGGGYRGESPTVPTDSGAYTQSGGGGGGGNAEWCHSGQGGGGGGHGSSGRNGYAAYHGCGGGWSYAQTHARGGSALGSAALTRLYMGPGGGSGGVDGDNPDDGGGGGKGGGIVLIFANEIAVSGNILARGQKGLTGSNETGGGGSGAGGSILIATNKGSIGTNKVLASGGPEGTAGRPENRGGYGGVGRIAVRYAASISGSSSPGFHKSQHAVFSKKGIAVSTDLVSGKSAIGFYSFSYALSALPAGTSAALQFSQDSAKWYDANGGLNKSTAMKAGGTQTVPLKLGWNKGPFRYRALLTGDAQATPKLDFVELNYVTK